VKVFVDTWAWLTLYDRREARHNDVADFFRRFRSQGGQLYTSDYVLDETITLLFSRLLFSQAQEALSILDQAIKDGYLALEWMTPERFERTKALRIGFQDKPRISFTDLASMAVMEELGISQILTGDAHFTHVGMGFQVVV
jgi:predicted nucleic acid-binding protein